MHMKDISLAVILVTLNMSYTEGFRVYDKSIVYFMIEIYSIFSLSQPSVTMNKSLLR